MKNHFSSKTLIALAVAAAVAAGCEGLANAQPMPPSANASALPANIPPGTPVAEVVKLAQSGVDASVIQNYISSCPSAFNIDADKIISLTDAGVSSDMVNAMIAHDKNLSAAAAPPAAASPAPADNADVSAPATEMTVNDFYDTLTPYGSWVEVEGYGRCWRPTVVVYDTGWSPYCDRGHWVYTDCGWFWDSDYSWGVTFHYGRWFHHDRFGWCWWPDTVWAPSWVTWRSCDDYCGWAPLPPFTVYQPGVGFFYRGVGVAVGFDFGLNAGCFTFVSPDHFCDRRPRDFRAAPQSVTQIFNRTTVINNYRVNNRIVVNGGISVDRFSLAGRRPIQAVAVAQIPNAGRQGWRGNDANGSGALRHGPVLRNGQNNNPPAIHQPERAQPSQTPNRSWIETAPAHPQSPAQPGNRTGLRDDVNRNLTPPAGGNNSAPGTPVNREQPQNYSGETGRRFNATIPPTVPAHSQPQTPPVLYSPHNSPPAAAQAQNQSRSQGLGSDKQNH